MVGKSTYLAGVKAFTCAGCHTIYLVTLCDPNKLCTFIKIQSFFKLFVDLNESWTRTKAVFLRIIQLICYCFNLWVCSETVGSAASIPVPGGHSLHSVKKGGGSFVKNVDQISLTLFYIYTFNEDYSLFFTKQSTHLTNFPLPHFR